MENSRLSGQLTSLPGRYARSLYELAAEQSRLNKIIQEYAAFISLLKSRPEIEHTLLNPVLSRSEHREIFKSLSHKLELDPLLEQFFLLLADNRRLAFILDIQSVFQQIYDEQENIQHVEIVSAFPLTSVQQQRINKILSQQVFGTLQLKFLIDPKILGGIFVRFGNHVIDLTFANHLNQLTTLMKGNS